MSFPLPSPSDSDLAEINKILDWHAAAELPDGRLLGRLDRNPGKRNEPARVPDPRIRWLNRAVKLKGKSVLEIGCFEGIHTIGLKHFTDSVTAIDVRPQNVVKTLTRLSWHGLSANVYQFDADRIGGDFPKYDVIFHFGVLYHMLRPVEHLINLGAHCDYLYLDTHVAADSDMLMSFAVGENVYDGVRRNEGGWSSPFAGTEDAALWLTRDSLMRALRDAGFVDMQILQDRAERNGPRLLILAWRDPKKAPPPPKQAAKP
ncbi:MAG: class I SAM-dependent methyltransferase [Hyphomonadaceae bacterium]